MIIQGVLLTVMLFGVVFLYILYRETKGQAVALKITNKFLNSELTEYKAKSASLYADYQDVIKKLETRLLEPGTTVSWIDRHGETETGVVLDDYSLNNKNYVVVIRMKNNKNQGAPISVAFEKLNVI
jgi:TFIIF-interacting CTD phosphatase-like protein